MFFTECRQMHQDPFTRFDVRHNMPAYGQTITHFLQGLFCVFAASLRSSHFLPCVVTVLPFRELGSRFFTDRRTMLCGFRHFCQRLLRESSPFLHQRHFPLCLFRVALIARCLCYFGTSLWTSLTSTMFCASCFANWFCSFFVNCFLALLCPQSRPRQFRFRFFALWFSFMKLRYFGTSFRTGLTSDACCTYFGTGLWTQFVSAWRVGIVQDIKANRAIVGAQCIQVILFPLNQLIAGAQLDNIHGKRIRTILRPSMLQMFISVNALTHRPDMGMPSTPDNRCTTNIDLARGDTGDLINAGGIRKWYTRHISDPFSIVGHALGCLQQRGGLRVSEKSIPRSAVYRNRTR